MELAAVRRQGRMDLAERRQGRMDLAEAVAQATGLADHCAHLEAALARVRAKLPRVRLCHIKMMIVLVKTTI